MYYIQWPRDVLRHGAFGHGIKYTIHIYPHYIYIATLHKVCTGWQRAIGCILFVGHFLQKSPRIRGSFAKKDLKLKACYATWAPCMHILLHIVNDAYIFYDLQYIIRTLRTCKCI